jgi:hypothetical protein
MKPKQTKIIGTKYRWAWSKNPRRRQNPAKLPQFLWKRDRPTCTPLRTIFRSTKGASRNLSPEKKQIIPFIRNIWRASGIGALNILQIPLTWII